MINLTILQGQLQNWRGAWFTTRLATLGWMRSRMILGMLWYAASFQRSKHIMLWPMYLAMARRSAPFFEIIWFYENRWENVWWSRWWRLQEEGAHCYFRDAVWTNNSLRGYSWSWDVYKGDTLLLRWLSHWAKSVSSHRREDAVSARSLEWQEAWHWAGHDNWCIWLGTGNFALVSDFWAKIYQQQIMRMEKTIDSQEANMKHGMKCNCTEGIWQLLCPYEQG